MNPSPSLVERFSESERLEERLDDAANATGLETTQSGIIEA